MGSCHWDPWYKSNYDNTLPLPLLVDRVEIMGQCNWMLAEPKRITACILAASTQSGAMLVRKCLIVVKNSLMSISSNLIESSISSSSPVSCSLVGRGWTDNGSMQGHDQKHTHLLGVQALQVWNGKLLQVSQTGAGLSKKNNMLHINGCVCVLILSFFSFSSGRLNSNEWITLEE